MQRVSEKLSYDPQTGKLFWNRCDFMSPSWNARYAGKEAGCIAPDGYVVVRSCGEVCKGHILAWKIQTGEWPSFPIDHKDRVRHNNSWSNLRKSDGTCNAHNKPAQKNSLTGKKGVGFRKDIKKFYSRISHGGKTHFLGYVDSESEAIRRYNEKADQLYGSHASHV